MGQLLAHPDIDLISFGRHRAYRHRLPFLSRVVLGQGALDLGADIPSADVSLLAAAAGLVARPDLHQALVPLLLGALREVHGNGGLFAEPGTFPSTRYLDIPLKPAARQYLERGPSFLHRLLPFSAALAIVRLKILLLPLITS